MSVPTEMQLSLFEQNFPTAHICDNCKGECDFGHYTDIAGQMWCEDCYEENYFTCEHCEKEFFDLNDRKETPDGSYWCKNCFNGEYIICSHCEEYVYGNDAAYVPNSHHHHNYDTLCERCVDHHCIRCDCCGTLVYTDNSVAVRDAPNICQSCYEDDYITCEECGDIVHVDDSHYDDYSCYCTNCRSYNQNFSPTGFRNQSGSAIYIGSKRCFGVELETDDCDGYDILLNHPAWGAKDDCTVTGKEFYSDILSGDEGLDAILEWAQFADNLNWDAGENAGYHLHLDLRKETEDSCYAVAYAYKCFEEVWLSFVESYRHNYSYSHAIRWTCRDILYAAKNRSFYSWCSHSSRFMWCNTAAFHDHSTIEIRLHQGTCDSNEIINWVKAHTRFVDWACAKGLDGVRKALDGMGNGGLFNFLIDNIWKDEELGKYYAEKVRHYNHGFRNEVILT
jgi:hypothetical protein